MPEKWTGDLVGRMHNERVTMEQIGQELGMTKSYVSMILNGKRMPKDAQKRLEEAYVRIIERRSAAC